MKKLIFVITSCIFLFTLNPNSSFAFEYGDNPRWYDPNFNWNYRDLKSQYRDNFALAVNYWDNTSAPISFSQISDSNYYVSDIRVKGSNLGNVDYNGIVYHYHASNFDTVTVNYSYIDNWTDENKLTRLFGHELGHVLGLDHATDPNQLLCTSKNGRIAYKPGSDDIAGANYLY